MFKKDIRYILAGYKVIGGIVLISGIVVLVCWLCTISQVFAWSFFAILFLFFITFLAWGIGEINSPPEKNSKKLD